MVVCVRTHTSRVCSGVRLSKNVAHCNVVDRLNAIGHFAVFDGTTNAPIDVAIERGAAGRISTAGGMMMT